MNRSDFFILVSDEMEKSALDDSLRAIAPTTIGAGIGGLGTLISNLLREKKITSDVLRNTLIGSGLGFGSSLVFPNFGLNSSSEKGKDKEGQK